MVVAGGDVSVLAPLHGHNYLALGAGVTAFERRMSIMVRLARQ